MSASLTQDRVTAAPLSAMDRHFQKQSPEWQEGHRKRIELQARAEQIAGELKEIYLRTRKLEREQAEVERLMREL